MRKAILVAVACMVLLAGCAAMQGAMSRASTPDGIQPNPPATTPLDGLLDIGVAILGTTTIGAGGIAAAKKYRAIRKTRADLTLADEMREAYSRTIQTMREAGPELKKAHEDALAKTLAGMKMDAKAYSAQVRDDKTRIGKTAG